MANRYTENDIFWETPSGNPALPNVYTSVFDNFGQVVREIAATDLKVMIQPVNQEIIQ